MERKIILTADGSATVYVPEIDATFHSRHGALAESLHVYVEAGLAYFRHAHPGNEHCRIFEMGFGTGLNAWLSARYAAEQRYPVFYEAVERYPLSAEAVQQLNYVTIAEAGAADWQQLHEVPWEQPSVVNDAFTLLKRNVDLLHWQADAPFNVVYYDAFSPGDQPELWTEEVFRRLYDALLPGGVLVTYCSKSVVRKALQAAGFTVHKVPGPWGKREILRAIR